VTSLASVLTAVALLAAVVALTVARSWRAAVRVFLDLLTAAGLIRLSADQGWTDLVTAAAIVALRRVLSAALFGDSGAGRNRDRGRGEDAPAGTIAL
jgi:hypothetical protein